MAQPSNFYGDVIFQGSATFAGSVVLPSSCVANANVQPAAAIDSSKLIHRFSLSRELFAPGTTIIAVAAALWHVARKGGNVVGIEAAITTAATGADRTVTVDLQKSTGGGAFATMLTTTVNITNATAIRTAVAGVVSGAGAFIDGDILQVTVAVAGAAGAQAAGLVVTVDVDQNPNT